MSRRTLNTQAGGLKNPSTRFLLWKSNEKCFAYWDKEAKKEVKVELPLKFQFLEHFHTVGGWNDASESKIFSNEVKFISKEELNVRSYSGGDIVKGIYSDVRLEIVDAGGKYFRSAYLVDEEGNIVNIKMKGAVVSVYSSFMGGDKLKKIKGNENALEGAWITIDGVDDHKKGATKYSTPIFKVGDAYTDEEMQRANEKYLEVSAYFKQGSEQSDEAPGDDADKSLADDPSAQDDIPF